jgi:hypothetical protein
VTALALSIVREIEEERPAVTPQALEVYRTRLTQVDFAKKQQWVVTNYAVLIYAAIVWVGKNAEPISTLLRCFLSFVIFVTGICAIGLIIRFQFVLRDARLRLDEANAYCFTDKQRDVLKLREFGVEHFEGPFWRGWEVLLALVLVCFVGATVAVCALFSFKTAS